MKINSQRMNLTSPSILGVGLVCLDIISSEEGPTHYYNGGSCGNVISALSFLGWNSSVITDDYSDLAQQIVERNFKKLGVNQITTKRHLDKTPRIIERLINKDGKYIDHQFISSCPNCDEIMPAIKPLDKKAVEFISRDTKKFNVLYADRASAGIQLLREKFNKQGAWSVYEPNSSRNVKAFLDHSLESHIVKFSSEKISERLAEDLRKKAKHGTTVLIVYTKGAHGLSFSYKKRDKTMSEWMHLPSQPVPEYVDAAGAGDWCTTGILIGLIGKNPSQRTWLTRDEVVASLQYGQALAAISCAFIGAQGLFYAEDGDRHFRTIDNDVKQKNKIKPTKLPSDARNELCDFCLMPHKKIKLAK